MESDILLYTALWMAPRDSQKYLGCLSKSFSEKLALTFQSQGFWKQIAINQTENSQDLLDKDTNDWETIYRARKMYPGRFRGYEKKSKEQVVKNLYWAANGTNSSRVALILLDLSCVLIPIGFIEEQYVFR